MDVDPIKRTVIAQQGLDFVTLFAAKFSGLNLSGYVPLLREPPEGSTAGGKQAVQHIVLRPKIDGDGMITIGNVNMAHNSARIRTYACLAKMHNMRFPKKPFHIDQRQYQDFFDRALHFMKAKGLVIDVETNPPEMERARTVPPPQRSALGSWVILFLLMAIAGALGYLIFTGIVKL